MRRESRQIMVGNVPVGGDAPITVQTMTNTPTSDAAATIDQMSALAASVPASIAAGSAPRRTGSGICAIAAASGLRGPGDGSPSVGRAAGASGIRASDMVQNPIRAAC